ECLLYIVTYYSLSTVFLLRLFLFFFFFHDSASTEIYTLSLHDALPILSELTSHVLRVAEVRAETGDACSVVFDPTPEQAQQLDYRPGQFLTVRVPSDWCGSVARCYSLSSSPYTDSRPQVTVKRTQDGYASHWICDNLTAGSEMEILPPSGVFTPQSLDHDLLLLAGGSGITPVMSIVKSALADGTGKITLLYA